ncbi:uncharacterized protein LOC101861337 [Aplysia californica]|uniref:Uncharacterized protein LOC101861337 n=1 Tax=Aplysia californica TaxID=6500 RepID=A0ABM0JC82_APLCA|nr:uncharacterized protein LOC101861337 [Aplysia californica]
MIIEILPLSWRRHVFWLGIVSFSFSTVLLVPFAYFLRHVTWTVFLLVICSGSVFIVPMYLLVDETLVWLVANGKAQQAKRLLRRACRWNNEDEESVIKLFEESIEFYDAKITGESLCEDETDVRAPHHEDRQYNHFNEKDVTNDRELITAPHVYVDSPQKSPPPYSFINGCDNDNVQIRGLNEDGCLTPLKDTQKHCESKTTHFTTKGVSDSLVIQNILEPSHFITHIGGNQEREELHPGNKGLCESLLQRDPQSDKEGTFPNRLCVVSSMSGADSLADHEASAPILNESKAVEKAKSSNLLMMFKNRTLCLNIIAFWIIWIVDSFSFFMLFLTSGMLADDLYLNFLLNSLAELPSVLLLIIVPGWLGRRASLTSYHVLSGSLLLVATFIKLASDAEAAKICASAVSILGKIGVSSAFTFLFAYTPEAFPTNMRNFAVGSSSTAGRIGGALAPFVNLLPTSTSWLPSVVFGVVSLATCLLIQILPETRGKELPQTVDDVMDWYTTEKGSSDKSFFKLKSRKNQRKQSR